jgi:RNA polymerase sigma-70 factor (ECF subfamily)
MRGESSGQVLNHLRTLYRCGVVGHLGDETLLERFLTRRDEMAEEAFAELVRRHGAMVLGVCRRVLGDAHEAEDAFQATFLVLARKAASVVRREKVANWLYGVAVRTAKEARGRAARRRAREEQVSKPIWFEPADDGCSDELRAILDEELARLPERYRGAVVLCELEGLSRPEAARRLGIPEGTLSSRLARAKDQLRLRLAHRGLALPVAALSALLLREARAASLPTTLIESTVEAAALVAVSPSAAAALSVSVASLTEGVLKTMLIAKLKGIALGIGTLATLVAGAVVLAQPQPEPVPKAAQNHPLIVSAPAPMVNPPPPTSEADRTAALEKKLDRILDALDRLSGTAPTPSRNGPLLPAMTSPMPVPSLPPGAPPPDSNLPESAPLAPGPQAELPPMPPTDVAQNTSELPPPSREPTWRRSSSMSRSLRSGSIADRLTAIEDRLEQLQGEFVAARTYTQNLANRLSELEQQVGGRSNQPRPSPRTPPPARR